MHENLMILIIINQVEECFLKLTQSASSHFEIIMLKFSLLFMECFLSLDSVSNKHKFQRAFWARCLNTLRALTNFHGPRSKSLIGSASMCILNFQVPFGPIH